MNLIFYNLLLFVFFIFFTITNTFGKNKSIDPTHIQKHVSHSLKNLNKNEINRLKFLNSLNSHLLKLTQGQISPIELQMALNKDFIFQKNGTQQTLSLAQLAQTLNAVENYFIKLNKDHLTAEGLSHLRIIEKGLKIVPQFLALAALTSKFSSPSKEAFAKQLSLIETLFTLPSEKMNTHIEMMEQAILNKNLKPSLAGEEAFMLALRNKYGEKADIKVDQLINCL